MTEQVMKFDAEVGKILKLMIHSLYTNKDIFLRELVSNASDACDKLRYLSLTDPSLIGENQQLKISIAIDEKARTITIADNGIGMNKGDMIENLGTIARSGTQNFLERLTEDSKSHLTLIGQFGVGFYSSFMVADEVRVISRKAGESETYEWKSIGESEFVVDQSQDDIERGTKVILHLREGEDQYLDQHRIRYIINTYSDHISVPIELVHGEDNKTEQLNTGSALWTRPKAEITEEQYKEFYKHVAHSIDDPWLALHNKNEGAVEYTNLLFIPSQKPFDLFNPDRRSRVKLYVKRVYITEESIDLVPAYMRFLRGIIDSEDLPLNISRETIQHQHIIDKIRKSVVKRVISELKKKLENDRGSYLVFWNNFGEVLKEGLCEATENREALLEICLFQSALTGKLITMNEYLENMQEGQNEIYYYLTGNAQTVDSPQLEGFLKKNIDVLLLNDKVDEFWVNVEHSFKEKDLQSVTKSGIELDQETKQEVTEPVQKLLDYFKTVLGESIKEAQISNRLVDSPACLTASQNAMDIRMERFLLEQKQLKFGSAKILELNLEHPIVKKIQQDLTEEQPTERTESLAHLLYDQACILEGEPIMEPSAFAKRLNKFLESSLA